MRVLIITACVLACAAAAPSVGVLAPALPTISSGDIAGAAIEAHAEAADHLRAAADAGRQAYDQAAELQGRAANAAEDHAWRAIDNVKTVEAQLDGAAAAAAPQLAKSLVRTPVVAPVAAYAAAPVAAYAPAVATPVATYAAAPVATYAAAPVATYAAAPVATYAAAPAITTYAAPATKTVVTQSLSQTHPAPAPAFAYAAAAPALYATPAAYAAAPVAYAAPAAYQAAPVAYAAHATPYVKTYAQPW
ncbi:hypothetical protein JYU34_006946 [Plutella xylostella]|uniref:Cuticle protein 16.5-like n=1 Tax=Plutella xylostella TaxID=51655 RepID=A0ABQ7QT83_PLUXY|nr:hypothetical protein JYU34_006946 [Plutella xylostella]